jgi:hypothetical protein
VTMTLLVIGATPANVRAIKSAASPHGVRVVVGRTSRRPDWVLVATVAQRAEALARYALPAFRVIEYPEIEGEGTLAEGVLPAGVVGMVEVGAFRPAVSGFGVALTRRLMPWITAWLGRVLVESEPEEADVPAPEVAARSLRKDTKLQDAHEAQLRAQRKAKRAAERAAEKAARRAEEQARAQERRP